MLVECDSCNALVEVEIVGSYTNENPHDFIDSTKYSLCKCSHCLSPMLIEQEFEWVNETFEWGKANKIYPANQFHLNPAIPAALQKALTECIQCYKAGAHTATAIMCRRTLEGFCLLKGIKGKSLDKSIKQMKEQGMINDQLFEWANQLRLVGNEAAHNIDANFSSLDAKDMMDFTIAILDFTYSFQEKFDQFKSRLSKTPASDRKGRGLGDQY